jgi:bifunctional DNA-binding transcriptional regulator/antitoxin component of YhaV-PrlF toxin-antitoxin module
MARIVARLGEGGRIVIPAEYRKALGVRAGDEAIRRAQAAVRAHVPPGRSLAGELIVERRQQTCASVFPS